jgi:hypothetical protein
MLIGLLQMLVTVAPALDQEHQRKMALNLENESFLQHQNLEHHKLSPTVKELG